MNDLHESNVLERRLSEPSGHTYLLSLGAIGTPQEHRADFCDPASLTKEWLGRSEHLTSAKFGDSWDGRWLQAWATGNSDRDTRRTLWGCLRNETSWARKLVLAMILSRLEVRARRASRAMQALAHAWPAYDRLRALTRRHGMDPSLDLLSDYVEHCRRTLGALNPPVAAGAHPAATLRRMARQLRRPVRRRPQQTMRALDAILAAGRQAPPEELRGRVAHQLARMLGARVLFHVRRGVWLEEIDQREHTIDSWTLRRLVRETGFRAHRVRPQTTPWRPGQRRPRALLGIPLDGGRLCLARRRPFRRQEMRAAQVVIRFLEERLEGSGLSTGAVASPDVSRGAPRQRPLALPGLVGDSAPWRDVLDKVWRVAPARCPVVLVGESGTGKEHLARGIHLASPRSQAPFVPVNCGALSESLLHAELFGHMRGAFTGADRSRQGLFEQAHKGTLFLDEVGEMPPSMQVALLRVLEDGKVLPLGGTRRKRVDVRVLAATHRDLDRMVAEGEFRADLLHRLDVMRIPVPPLRDRAEDIPDLARHLLARAEADVRMDPECWDLLLTHAWPGNVRELDNVLRAATLLSDDDRIRPDLMEHVLARRRERPGRPAASEDAVLSARGRDLLAVMGHGWWRAAALSEAIGVSARTVNRELDVLCEQGFVSRRGEARARRYRRADAALPEAHA